MNSHLQVDNARGPNKRSLIPSCEINQIQSASANMRFHVILTFAGWQAGEGYFLTNKSVRLGYKLRLVFILTLYMNRRIVEDSGSYRFVNSVLYEVRLHIRTLTTR
jgi:hypothetical protein